MRTLESRIGLMLALAMLWPAAAHAVAFTVIVNGRGQFAEAPLAPVRILYNSEGNSVFSASARFNFDSSRLQLQNLVPSGSVTCSQSASNQFTVTAAGSASGTCDAFLVPNPVAFPVDVLIDGHTAQCSGFGSLPCTVGNGSYRILGPDVIPSLAVGSSFTLSGNVGGPAPTRTIRVTNFGESGSVLRLSTSSDSPVTVTGGSATLGAGQFRDYVVSCPTTTQRLTTHEVRIAHNEIPGPASPLTYKATCDIRTPPNLLYSPTTGNSIAIPATNALSATRFIGIGTSGGQSGGSRALSCVALAGYSIEVVTSPFLTGSKGEIRLGCDASPVPASGTLTCTETPGSTRTWPVSCLSDEAFTATPSFDTPVVLTGLVGATAPTHSFVVTNTGTDATTLQVSPATGLSNPLSISTAGVVQSIPQGSTGSINTITCSSLASFSGTQTLSLAHNAPGSPSQLSVTCNMRQPPTLGYAPSFGNAVQVSASVGAATPTTNIAVSTTGGDPGGERSLTCDVNQPNYSVVVDTSPFGIGAAGNVRLGCDSINQQAATLRCTESPGGTIRQWPLTCVNTAVYTSSPRPGSAIGVYFPIGETGFVDADVAVSNKGTANLSVTGCVQTPTLFFGVNFTPNPIAGNSNGTLNVTCPQPAQGSADFRTLTCNTNDPTRQSIVYKLICVAPPMTDLGEGASPEARLTSPVPDGGALLGSSTVIATLDNGDEIVVVGAPSGGTDGDGRVYVYVRPRGAGAGALLVDGKRAGRGLGKPVAVLRAPANRGKVHAKGIGNKFGEDVAISNGGTFIAVGAPTGGGANTGEVLVFSMPPGGWDDLDDVVPVVIAAPDLTSPPPGQPPVGASAFGSDVEFSPDGTLVVGAPGAIVSSVDNAGAAFMFQTNGVAVGAPVTASSPEPGAEFGTSLDVSTGMLAVGAPGENNSTGAAYFFEIDASSSVGPANRQTAPGGSFGDKWGTEVAIGGASIIVGAPNDDTAAGADSGSATVFLQGDGNNVTFAATLIPPGGGTTQGAGAAIATNGDVVVLGAPLSDVGENVDRGRAIVYDLEAAAVGVGTPAGIYENTIGEAGDEFGSAIGISRGLLLLGAPLSDEGPDVDEGRVDPFELDRIFRGNFDF
ncbi:MAG TPA: FG-GAP repeat protein [Candidatus Saccharimonadia bacterium]|nr:FG-GAP repeat protein [Candidatus Saccharimonadia bacterium]